MDIHAVNAGLVSPITYILPALTCLLTTKEDEYKKYDGYKILRISNITTESAFDILDEIYRSDVLFEFLTPPSLNTPTDIMLCPEQVEPVMKIFKSFQIPFEIMVSDVQSKIEFENAVNEKLLREETGMNWNAFHPLSTIQNWMDDLVKKYPALVSVETYGESSEGRPMKVLKITTGGEKQKPAVWLDGGIHAREWVSPATVTYIANELINEAVSGGENYRFVNSVNWYIVPNMNPDGYEFSHTKDRMWRKTRSNDGSFAANVLGCRGTDPNRNWAYKWGGKGTSGNPCSQIYRGKGPASEPEVALTQNYILERKHEIKLALTFHSYSQMIFRPWGYDNVVLDDAEDLMIVARNAAKSLEAVHGTKYQVGSSVDLLYAAAGGTEDWMRGVAGIKFAYCYELRDEGHHGFILPPDQIIPSGEETFASVKTMVEGVMAYHKVEGF